MKKVKDEIEDTWVYELSESDLKKYVELCCKAKGVKLEEKYQIAVPIIGDCFLHKAAEIRSTWKESTIDKVKIRLTR